MSIKYIYGPWYRDFLNRDKQNRSVENSVPETISANVGSSGSAIYIGICVTVGVGVCAVAYYYWRRFYSEKNPITHSA